MDIGPELEMKSPANTNVRRVAGNMASILSSNVTIRATNFFMYVMVGRFLGVFQYGQLALAASLFYTVHMFALVGLKTLLTRQVAKDRTQTSRYFVNASVIVGATSILASLIMIPVVSLLDYNPSTGAVILLLFLGLLPYNLAQISEGVFQAWEKMEYIAYSQVPVNLLQFAVIAVLLIRGYEILPIVVVIAASYFVLVVVEWFFLVRYIIRPELKVDIRFSKEMLKASSPFLGIQGTNAIKSSISVLILSKLLGEAEVGIFSAASQLLAPMALIYESVVNTIFPIMVRKFQSGYQGLRRVTEKLIEFLFAIALPVVIGLLITAEAVLLLLYDDPEFLRSVTVLRILVWLPLGDALTKSLGQVLWASEHEKVSLRISVINTLIKTVVGFTFIWQFGLIGAALASVIVLFVNLIQHYLPVSKLLSGIQIGRHIWRPLLATVGMAAFLLLTLRLHVLIQIPLAAILYAILLVLVFIFTNGGLDGFKARYQFLWAKGER